MKVSALKFAGVALGVLLPPCLYLAYALGDRDPLTMGLLTLPFLSILSLPLIVMSADRSRESWWRDLVVYGAHFSMGLVTYLLVFSVVRDGLRLSGLYDLPTWAVYSGAAVALIGGALRAFTGPRVRHVRVPIENLDPRFENFRVAQISDLHAGVTIRRRYVERVVRLANAAKPDVVALTGDIADGDVTRTRDSVAPLADLTPEGRVFYVTGNHEYYWNVEDWLYEFKRLGCHLLLNEGVRVGDAWIAGITDPAAAGFGGPTPSLENAYAGSGDCGLKILLSHRPGYARAAGELGFDVQLSGHTHGGQFFPWTIVVRFVHEFNLGLMRAGKLWIYVSPGTGTWGPPFRVGTTPELTVLTVVRA